MQPYCPFCHRRRDAALFNGFVLQRGGTGLRKTRICDECREFRQQSKTPQGREALASARQQERDTQRKAWSAKLLARRQEGATKLRRGEQ